MSDKQIDHAQRIADRIQALNLALDTAYEDGCSITIYVLPSHVEDQDNPIVGVRLTIVRGDTEYIHWIGMDVPHTDD